MGRTASPWWWEERKGYYAFVRGSRKRLGTSLREAKDELKRLLSETPEVRVAQDHVVTILDDFLTWTEENRSPKTYRGYKDFIQSFTSSHPGLRIGELTAGDVTTWLNTQKTWNSTTKRNAITALQRGLNWAVKNRGMHHNPIRGMEKPEAKKRTSVVTLEEFKTILRHTSDRAFRWLLEFCWDVGTRPQEAKGLEAKHVDLEKRRCILSADEAKGKRVRVFYLATERSVRIVTRLMAEHPTGKLFLNTIGNPWTASAVKCRFAVLEKTLGKRFHQYAWRHTFITRKLVAGVDSHIVAKLSGHVSTEQLDATYSHVADDYKFMLEAASRELKKG